MDKLPNLALVIDLTNTTRYYDPSKLNTFKSRKKVATRRCNEEQNKGESKSDSHSDMSQEPDKLVPEFAESSSICQFKPLPHIKIFTRGHTVPNAKIVKRYII